MLIRVAIVLSISITICISDNVIQPEKFDYHINPVKSSVNNYRKDEPYQYSVVHNTPKSSKEYYSRSNPTKLQIQYAPLMKPEDLRLHRGQYTKLSPGDYLMKINTKTPTQVKKKPLEPRIEPENLISHAKENPQPSNHIDYVPGHNIEVLRSVDRYPGHNAIYHSAPSGKSIQDFSFHAQDRQNAKYHNVPSEKSNQDFSFRAQDGHNAIYHNVPSEKSNQDFSSQLNPYGFYPRMPDQRKDNYFYQYKSNLGTTKGTTTAAPTPSTTTTATTPRYFHRASSPASLVVRNPKASLYNSGNYVLYALTNVQQKQKNTSTRTKLHKIFLNVARKYKNQQRTFPVQAGYIAK